MRERSGRERLDRDSGRTESPRITQFAHNSIRIIATPRRLEEAARRFQDLVGGRPAERGKIGGGDTGLGRPPGMKRLGHRAKILTQARRLAACDPQGVESLRDVKATQFSGRRGSPESSTGSGGVKTLIIMSRRDRLGDLGLYLDPDMISEQQ